MKLLWGKFLIKCFLVLMPFWIVWGYIWLFPMNYINSTGIHYLSNKNVVNDMNQSYDVVILGDSVSNASFAPEYMSEGTLNLGMNTATPIEAYFVLSEYLEKHKAPKTCFLAFALHHMAGENYLYEANFFSHRFSVRQELEILKQAELYNEKSILKGGIYNSYKKWLSYRLRLPNKYIHALINSFPKGRKGENCNTVKQSLMHRGTMVSRSVRESNDYKFKYYKDYIVHPLYDAYYRKIFDLCNENGIQVHIVMTPICTNVFCMDKYQKSLHAYHQKIQEDYPNVTFLDRLDGFERQHLQDTHHVNIHGSLKFSKAIKRLYPEAFEAIENDSISRNTIDGMVDYLKLENYPSEILRRVENTNFSVLIIRWPNMGGNDEDLLASVDECYPLMREQVGALCSRRERKEAAVFFVNGLDKNNRNENSVDGIRLWNTPQSAWILRMNGTKASLVLPWEKKPVDIDPKLAVDMTVVIVNCYDKKIISVKNFAFSHGSYKLIQ